VLSFFLRKDLSHAPNGLVTLNSFIQLYLSCHQSMLLLQYKMVGQRMIELFKTASVRILSSAKISLRVFAPPFLHAINQII